MKLSDVKAALAGLDQVQFKLPDGTYLPPHFHVTEVGLITKNFIDCGGTQRSERVINFQLWSADDYDHRLAPQKFLKILDISKKIIGEDDLEIEVEYQQSTIGKFGLAFNDGDFVLVNKQTACLAEDACGIPQKTQVAQGSCCGTSGCC